MGENAKVILDFRKLISDFSHYYFWKNKNRKCPIDAHYHCHRRRDLRFTKDCIEFPMNSRCLWAVGTESLFLERTIFPLSLPVNIMITFLAHRRNHPCPWKSEVFWLYPRFFGILYSPWRILRSFLQWRWQWASIGHFVFLFNWDPPKITSFFH